MKPLSLKQRYDRICQTYVDQFCAKHGVEFDGWVNDWVGEIAWIGSCPISFDDIRHDLDNEVPKEKIWDFLETIGGGEQINYRNFLKL